MVAKHCEGKIPEPGTLTEDDEALLTAAAECLDASIEHVDKQSLHRFCESVILVARLGNKYIDTQAPWTLRKTDVPRMCTVLYVLVEAVRRMAIVLEPVMPTSCSIMLDQIGAEEKMRTFASVRQRIAPGTQMGTPSPIFPKVESLAEETVAEKAELGKSKKQEKKKK